MAEPGKAEDLYHQLRSVLRPFLMEWVSARVAEGCDYEGTALVAAGLLTVEAVTIAKALDRMPDLIELAGPLYAGAAPESVSVLTKEQMAKRRDH